MWLYLLFIHSQLNFLYSDWLVIKYIRVYCKCLLHSVYCTQTARGAFGVWCAHQKHLAQSGRSTPSAVDICNTLDVFTKEPMSAALRVLRPDCARCFWCVMRTQTSRRLIHFFHWVKLLIFLMFSFILRLYLCIIFHEHEQMIFFFYGVWIRLINLHLL